MVFSPLPTDWVQHGHTTVGTVAVQLCNSFKTYSGILLRCPVSEEFEGKANTRAVFVGHKNVTAGIGPTGGIPILPGGSVVIPIDDPSKLWVISESPDQDIAWMGV